MWDIVFEFILEIFFEGSLELTKNKKISKWIRYPLMFLIILLFVGVIALMLAVAIAMYKTSILASLFLIGLTIFMLVGSVAKLRNVWMKQNDKTN
ncbi:MAG: hypothetical protein IJO63_03010 [Bacilli bacterium]|nr:hypothetical protein [Bacilli bacterium]